MAAKKAAKKKRAPVKVGDAKFTRVATEITVPVTGHGKPFSDAVFCIAAKDGEYGAYTFQAGCFNADFRHISEFYLAVEAANKIVEALKSLGA